jgi:hypothetical protein
MNKKVILSKLLVVGMFIFTLSVAFSQPVKASHIPVDIVAIPSESGAQVYSLTRVYSEPDDASRMVEVLSPGTHFNILGFTQDGSFIEIGKEGQSLPSGWVASSQVTRNHLDGTSLSLTQAYLLPSSSSKVATLVTPGTELQVLGHSVDGAWLAIDNPGSMKTPIYWIAASAVRLPEVIAQTSTLTKAYISPDTSSRITNVLPPAQQVTLIGRNSTNSWFAVEGAHSSKYIGWVQSSDLDGGLNRELLPVLSMK